MRMFHNKFYSEFLFDNQNFLTPEFKTRSTIFNNQLNSCVRVGNLKQL